MKAPLSAAFAITLTLALPIMAAEKKPKKPSGKPSTIPSTSPMIVVPPPTDPAVTTGEPPKLITSEMSGQDLLFFTTVVDAGRLQAYLVELLTTKASSDQIKALGNALASTQQQENKQIARLASQKGWKVSTEPTEAQKTLGAALEKETGSHFDKAVMDKVISANQQAVEAYQTAAQSTDADIKDFAAQMLPLAKEKLRLVEKMTGAGKAAAGLFRTGATPKPVATPKPAVGAATPTASGATPKPVPPPITK